MRGSRLRHDQAARGFLAPAPLLLGGGIHGPIRPIGPVPPPSPSCGIACQLFDAARALEKHPLEGQLAEIVKAHWGGTNGNERGIVAGFMESAGAIEVTDTLLKITLERQATPQKTELLARLCDGLTVCRTTYPRTDLRMVFRGARQETPQQSCVQRSGLHVPLRPRSRPRTPPTGRHEQAPTPWQGTGTDGIFRWSVSASLPPPPGSHPGRTSAALAKTLFPLDRGLPTGAPATGTGDLRDGRAVPSGLADKDRPACESA